MKPVSIGLLGFGTVGRGVACLLRDNAAAIERRAGAPIRIGGVVVRDLARAEAFCAEQSLSLALGTDGDALVADPDIDIVCELAGGDDPAFRWTRAALENGKHVVTANKALIATRGKELFAAAADNGARLRFEAAIAGGIPIVKALREGLAANRVEWLAGIINGTGNFILSEMATHGREFADVLAEAQALGYAEADPTFDVEGVDAAHKLAILASIAFGTPLDFDSVLCEGISRIERADVLHAAELGYVIKHLGVARRRDIGIEMRVHPALIPARRLLANVDGVMNAVVVQCDAVGPTLYYGAGAGAGPTGSAVVADLIDIVRGGGEPLGVPGEARGSALRSLGPEDFESAFYLRLVAADRPGVLAVVAGIFGELEISIEALLQKEPAGGVEHADDPDLSVPVILLTRRVREGLLREAVRRVEALDSILGEVVVLRVETLDSH